MATVLLLAALAAPPSATHDKAFWRAIADAKFEVPAGESAAGLARELTAVLGSPDPELRDDLAFTILSAWIYDKRLLGPDDLRSLSETLERQLRRGIDTAGTDDVLLRSFSALTLSIVAARDNATPFLTAAEFTALLDAALQYFRDERDSRGFDAEKGWIHAAAHTSDLLKFLARSARLQTADQSRIFDALIAKNRDSRAPFAQGEDERMARVAVSIVRRADFDRPAFTRWLEAARATATFPRVASVDVLRAHQNMRHLLSALWAELSADERPSEGADFARTALREALKTLF